MLVDQRRNHITEDEAIICLDHEYNDIPDSGTYVDAYKYFSHQYDAIVKIKTKHDRDVFNDHFKRVFPSWMMVAAHLWETLPHLNADGYYINMHSYPFMDLWWSVERRKLGVPLRYLAVHILTDSDYHKEKLIDFNYMRDTLINLSDNIPIVIVGSSINPVIEHNNIWDLTGNSIDESIAVVNKCNVFVGGDTGISHVAGALGKPVIDLFPGDQRWHNDSYDAVVSIPKDRLTRIFLNGDGTFDKSFVLETIEKTYDRWYYR